MVGFTDCKLASMSQTRKYSVFQLNSRNPGSENVSPNWPEVRNCFFNGLAPFKSSQKDLEFSIETANVFLLGIKFQAFLVFVLLYSALSPQTEWHISHRDLFLSSESWDVPDPGAGRAGVCENLLLKVHMQPSYGWSLQAEAQSSSVGLFYKDTDPAGKGFTLTTQSPPQAPPPNTIIFVLGFTLQI